MLSLRTRGPFCVLLVVGALLAAPAPASAWTEAQVRTATANVEVAADGSALVHLTLGVRVRGGWLEGLELAGLDPDLVLDPDKVPWMVADEGEKFHPEVRVRSDGRVRLRFRRREAPRRGNYTVGLTYRTNLAHRATEPLEGDLVRVHWTLPGWRSGLEGVTVHLSTPPGAQLSEEATLASLEHERREVVGRTVFRFRRAHLPRTVPWTVSVDVPAGSMDPELRGRLADVPVLAPPLSTTPSGPRHAPLMICAIFALVAFTKRSAYDDACARARVTPRPLVALPWGWVRGASVLVAALGAATSWPTEPVSALGLLLCIVLLSVQRTPLSTRPPAMGGWRLAKLDDQRRATRLRLRRAFSLQAMTDATQPIGLVVLGAAVLAVGAVHGADPRLEDDALVHAGHGLILLLALMLTGTSSQLPSAPLSRLGTLRRMAGELRGPGLSAGLMVHEDTEQHIQDVRLRIESEVRTEGLLRLDLTLASEPSPGGVAEQPVLVLLTRAGSEANARAANAELFGAPIHGPGGRRARVARIAANPTQAVEELLSILGAEGPRIAQAEPARTPSLASPQTSASTHCEHQKHCIARLTSSIARSR